MSIVDRRMSLIAIMVLMISFVVLCGFFYCTQYCLNAKMELKRFKRNIGDDNYILSDESGKQYRYSDSQIELDRAHCFESSGCSDPNRRCFHVSRSVRLKDGTVLRANTSIDEGYCLQLEGSNIECDRRFGESITTITSSGRLRTECRCFWPTLFDRKDVTSDCSSLVYACGGTGKLIHISTGRRLVDIPSDELIDIHDFRCDSESGGVGDCAIPGRDLHTGLPTYVPTPVDSRTGGLCLYENISASPVISGRHTTATSIAVKGAFVSDTFADSFKTDSEAYVPNPCAFDTFRPDVLLGNECRLTLTPSGIGYCEPLSETVSTVQFDDDYLPKNGGRYSNACYKFTESKENVDAYIGEYFVRPGVTLRIPGDQDGTPVPPLPVMSVEIDARKLFPEILNKVNAVETANAGKKLLITQAAFPEDVEKIPVPFDKTTMSRFQKEHNDFVHYLPAKYAMFHYWVPVQTVKIPDCDEINTDRELAGITAESMIEANEYEIERQRHVVACRSPHYDKRLSIVPNIDVNPMGNAYNANPTSAVLRFDKADYLVRPYWYRSFFNNRREVKTYVSNLPSRPHPELVEAKKR